MNCFTLALNTATSLFIVPAIQKAWCKHDYLSTYVFSWTFVLSTLMHLTETKHGLQPPVLAEYSQLFLNADRISSFLTFAYGLYLVRNASRADILGLVPRLAAGTVALRLGEWTSDLWLYNLLHTVWHWCAFTTLHRILDL